MKTSRLWLGKVGLVAVTLLVILFASSLAMAQSGGGFSATPLLPEGETIELSKPGGGFGIMNAGPSTNAIDPSNFEVVSVIVTLEDGVSVDAVAAAADAEVVNRYDKVFNGGSLVLAGDDVDSLAAIEGVTGIYLDTLEQLTTEVSPQFIGAPTAWNALGGQGSAGEGVVVGILDSGIWPEHPSVSDPDPLGKPYDPPPITPASCDFGSAVPGDAPFTCNNKLIGAYQFMATYKLVNSLLPTEFDSARDDNGHGTHTATTAAGNRGVNASLFGNPFGVVSGVAPRAHIIAYRVCGDAGCYQSDSVAAVNQAIADGVDVINFSISGGESPYGDAVELAFAAAYENGVFVATSAGNSGPGANTVAHRSPWVTTVAASTSNRHFLSTLTLEGDNGDTLEIIGATITGGIDTPLPVVFPPAGQELCNATFNPAPGTYTGQIVICRRGDNARLDKGYRSFLGGAAGMILYNPAIQGLNTDNHYLPTVHIDQPDSDAMLAFISSHSGVTATFTEGTSSAVPGDAIASFSSRGGPGLTLGAAKPDITAPGVQILAGHTPSPATYLGGPSGELFQAIQGTSMSSPHIAGAAALLADMHPDWTPGQIKSAMMTSAVTDIVTEDGVTPATPFDTGSGRIDLTRAGSVDFTFDETIDEFFAHQDDLWHANLPSLYVPELAGKLTVERTIRNVTNKNQTWKLSVEAEPGLIVNATKNLVVGPGKEVTFQIEVSAPSVPMGETRHAILTFKKAHTTYTFPITIVRGQGDVVMTKTCTPLVAVVKVDQIDCTITFANNSFDDATFDFTDILPKEFKLIENSVVGASAPKKDRLEASGNLAGAEPPNVLVDPDPGGSPAGYLPLSTFGIAPAAIGDESMINFNVPAFTYAGETWSRIGVVSNGYIVVGGGVVADIDWLNQELPDSNIPNNVLAPFWTDLNPPNGGALRVGILTDGVDSWIVVEWANVPNYSNPTQRHNMQVWILMGATEGIHFTYGPNAGGDNGLATVGAENKFGNRGDMTFYNGTGTLPVAGTELRVSSTPLETGGSHTVTFSATGKKAGDWENCAELTTSITEGTIIACASGTIIK